MSQSHKAFHSSVFKFLKSLREIAPDTADIVRDVATYYKDTEVPLFVEETLKLLEPYMPFTEDHSFITEAESLYLLPKMDICKVWKHLEALGDKKLVMSTKLTTLNHLQTIYICATVYKNKHVSDQLVEMAEKMKLNDMISRRVKELEMEEDSQAMPDLESMKALIDSNPTIKTMVDTIKESGVDLSNPFALLADSSKMEKIVQSVQKQLQTSDKTPEEIAKDLNSFVEKSGIPHPSELLTQAKETE